MKKRATVTITAIILSLAIVGCASGNNTDSTKTKNAFEQTVESYLNEKKGYIPEDSPSFLSEENKELFSNADYIYFNFSVCGGFDLIDYENEEYVDIDKDGTTYRYYKTDYDYADFVDYIKSVFTDDAADSLINGSDFYIDIDGKLCCMDGARGSDISYAGKKYELISESKDEIDFKAIAQHSWAGAYENEQQYRDEGNTDAFEWEEEYTFKIIKTENGFRIAEFEYWK